MFKVMKLLIVGVLMISYQVTAQHQVSQDTINFITSDLSAFWNAFDKFKKDTASNPFANYVSGGTDALKKFQRYHIKDSAEFKRVIRENLDYYEQVRGSAIMVGTYQQQVTEYFHQLKKLYPAALKPDVTFVIGAMNAGASVDQRGITVGLEVFSDTVVKNSYGRKSTEISKLPLMLASCMVFFQQRPAHTEYNLLRQSIIHGSADFITTLFIDDAKTTFLAQPNYIYGEQHEEELVKEFLRMKDSNDFSLWLYNDDKEGRPANLAHFVGYKITESFYNSFADKDKALEEILKINDFNRFMLISGYIQPFMN